MRLDGFRHKGLRQVHAGAKAKGVPPAMADKLRKLLFAMETAKDLDQVNRFPGWKLASAERRFQRFLEPNRHGKLALDSSLRRSGQWRQRYRLDRLSLGGA